jgi:hypothetical protein
MFLMLFFILGVDQDVINDDHDKLAQLRHKHQIHQVHEMGRSISKPIRHNQILIKTVSGGECCFRNILRTDFDLMITQTDVNLGEDSSTRKWGSGYLFLIVTAFKGQ